VNFSEGKLKETALISSSSSGKKEKKKKSLLEILSENGPRKHKQHLLEMTFLVY